MSSSLWSLHQSRKNPYLPFQPMSLHQSFQTWSSERKLSLRLRLSSLLLLRRSFRPRSCRMSMPSLRQYLR